MFPQIHKVTDCLKCIKAKKGKAPISSLQIPFSSSLSILLDFLNPFAEDETIEIQFHWISSGCFI